MKTLQEKTRANEFVVTAEIVPAAAGGSSKLVREAEVLKGLVDAINVTDGAGASTALSSAAASAILAANGFEPVLQLTCRDRNRLALCADMLGASAQGISNLLILTGDDPSKGDQPDAKPVFDLDSGELMRIARAMRDDAVLPNGKSIDEAPDFFLGVADVPIDPPEGWEPKGLLAKMDNGAQFAQTQFCFDPEIASRYISTLRARGITDRLSIILGIGPIASARSARWMDENLYGVSMPESVIARLEASGDGPAQKLEGIQICRELLAEYRNMDGVAGVHIMAPAASATAIAQVLE
jgi:methylenetetrahydrofolate reductase (NADPH)